MEKFLNTLLEQIRCKKAKPYIEEEIRGHIEDQIAAGIACGMTKEAAEQAAIADMGSPVEIGISLDRIHRPQMAWGMLLLMSIISIAGIVAHLFIRKDMVEVFVFAGYTAIGIVLMILIYRIDYTVIARFSTVIAFLFLALIFLAHVGGIGSRIDGRVAYINLGAIHISICSLMMLYIPLYGAIIYKYHGMGYRGLIKSLIWMIVSVFIALRLTDIGVAIMVLVSMAAVLSIAIWEDWFSVARKKIIAGLWGCIGGFSILILCVPLSFGGIASYQVERLRAFITNGGATDYFTTKLRSTFFSSKIWGNGGKDISGQLPNLNNDYIITFLTSTYGIIIGIVVCCILVTLTVKVFSVSVKQKNQLGMIMGCGCGMVFFINIMINILENMGLLPTMQTFLPFFSIAGSNIIACYILIGIALSVYRYKNIFPKHVDKKDITLGIRING